MAQLGLARARQGVTALGVDEQQGVVVLPKGGGADIAHQQRHILAHAFGAGVLQQIVAFGGKAHAVQSATVRTCAGSHGGQDVGVLDKRQAGHLAAAIFFDFLCGKFGWPPICNSGSSYEN